MLQESLYKLVKEKLHGAHDFSHIERILKYAKQIHAAHSGNWKIIEAALLLHEITKNDLDSIKTYVSDFTEEESAQVTDCVRYHYNFVDKPKTLEGKIVQDCDILDMLGAVGIARGFVASGEKGLNLPEAKDEYKRKRFLVMEQLNLDESKKMAEKKSQFTKLFFNTIEEEME